MKRLPTFYLTDTAENSGLASTDER